MAEKVVHSAGPDREFGLQPAVGPRLCLIGVFQIVRKFNCDFLDQTLKPNSPASIDR